MKTVSFLVYYDLNSEIPIQSGALYLIFSVLQDMKSKPTLKALFTSDWFLNLTIGNNDQSPVDFTKVAKADGDRLAC